MKMDANMDHGCSTEQLNASGNYREALEHAESVGKTLA